MILTGNEDLRVVKTIEKNLLMSFVNETVLCAYRQWVEDGKKMQVGEVIKITNRAVLGGVNGFFR